MQATDRSITLLRTRNYSGCANINCWRQNKVMVHWVEVRGIQAYVHQPPDTEQLTVLETRDQTLRQTLRAERSDKDIQTISNRKREGESQIKENVALRREDQQ